MARANLTLHSFLHFVVKVTEKTVSRRTSLARDPPPSDRRNDELCRKQRHALTTVGTARRLCLRCAHARCATGQPASRRLLQLDAAVQGPQADVQGGGRGCVRLRRVAVPSVRVAAATAARTGRSDDSSGGSTLRGRHRGTA
eukprot:2798223-Prymnesium_polylepis.1